MTGGLMLFPERRHSHLRLAGAVSPGSRQVRRPGFSRPVHYTDRKGHGRTLRDEVLQVRTEHKARVPVLGVAPELVVVLETNSQLAPEDVERAGLTVLELRSDRALVAFASDPEMTEFLRRNAQYQEGPRGLTDSGNERTASYQSLFDGIDQVRGLEVDDVLSAQLADEIASAPAGRHVRVDIQCWCGEDETAAYRRNEEVRAAVALAGGTVLDHGVRSQAGWSTVCADIPADRVRELASVDRIRWVDLLPRPVLSYPQLREAGIDDLPAVVAPGAEAPIIAVIDSGIRSAHPLLAPAIVGVEYIEPALGDGGDEAGHGTLVASLALYGPLEEALSERLPVQAAGRLLSVRVLDRDNNFPNSRSWVAQLLDALELAVEAGARVINLSLGDPRNPYLPPRPTPVAALVDLFVRDHPDVVVVVSTGNFPPSGYTVESLLDGTYPETLLSRDDAGLLDPATAALALTVGALCSDQGQGAHFRVAADVKPVGGPGRPSLFSRVGPGASGMIKPELCAPGGSATVDTLSKRVDAKSPATSVVGAGGADQNRLLAIDAGTSYAAPLVAHAALRVAARYPTLSGNAVRALTLLSCEPVEVIVEGARPSINQERQRRLTGYGRVSASRAESSTDHRAVLLSEAEIVVDGVHLYVVPIPSTFFSPGGQSSVSVGLAYDPPVRATRLDYLANRIGLHIYHGVSIGDVERAYVIAEETDELADDVDAAPADLSAFKLQLQPADTARSRGTNHFARCDRSRLDSGRGNQFVLAIRNVNRWDTPGAVQRYAVAVALERDLNHPDLYSELQLQLEAVAAVEIEGEVEI